MSTWLLWWCFHGVVKESQFKARLHATVPPATDRREEFLKQLLLLSLKPESYKQLNSCSYGGRTSGRVDTSMRRREGAFSNHSAAGRQWQGKNYTAFSERAGQLLRGTAPPVGGMRVSRGQRAAPFRSDVKSKLRAEERAALCSYAFKRQKVVTKAGIRQGDRC